MVEDLRADVLIHLPAEARERYDNLVKAQDKQWQRYLRPDDYLLGSLWQMAGESVAEASSL